MNRGKPYSTSQFCGHGVLVGGPFDGDTYFNDYPSGVTFCMAAEKVNHTYMPKLAGSWAWFYEGPWYWDAGEREYQSWFPASSAAKEAGKSDA